MAQQVLTQFQDHPESWTRVPDILEKSSFPQTKVNRVLDSSFALILIFLPQYIGLQILEKLIQTKWKTLPEGQRQGELSIWNDVLSLIVGKVFGILSSVSLSRPHQTKCLSGRRRRTSTSLTLHLSRSVAYLLLTSRFTDVLQILKQEWPHNWPTFITELVESSKTNLSLCENNMVILKLLSEEVFDFSAEQMTQARIKNLKNQMCGEFSEIFKLCSEVLEEAQKVALIKATLETLLRFLNWIPLGYIFETTIIDLLLNRVCRCPFFMTDRIQHACV